MGLSFTSLEFLAFLGVCLTLVVGTGWVSVQKWLLIMFSYLVYLSFGVVGVSVVTLTAVADFHVGRRLESSVRAETRKRWLWAGLAVNLGPLVFFKYSAFLVDSVADLLRSLGGRIAVPGNSLLAIVGLSYFTFGGMTYIL